MTLKTRTDYLKLFEGQSLCEKTKQAKALEIALDVRKFEIETYWKRGTYFWTVIGAAFVALFAVGLPSKLFENIIIANLGFLFSMAWYFVNRGSAAWQRNWEAQVDVLEDEVMGPLFKSVLNRRTYRLLAITTPYAFSPSRINTILSFIVAVSWLIFIIRDYAYLVTAKGSLGLLLAVIDAIVVAAAAWAMCEWGGSGKSDEKRSIDLRLREYD